jgi:hypothetical protein
VSAVGIALDVFVAVGARKDRVRSRTRVAISALRPPAPVSAGIDLEVLLVMVKRRRFPRRGGVTRETLMTEVRNHVIRVRGASEIWLMALVAVRIHQLVVAVHVTSLTLLRGMRSGQRELRRVVVKRSRPPGRRRVALNAILRKARGLMIGIGCVCPCGPMAIEAVRCQCHILIVHVTIPASHCAMCSGEWKRRVVVRKDRRPPGTCAMTRLADRGKFRGCMVRIQRRLIVRLVAGKAIH